MYSQPAHFQCRARGPRGNDVHAERRPQAGRDQALLRAVLGSHVADFPFFALIRETSRPRLESTILAIARPREVLVQSSATRDLALALGHRPRPLGAHLDALFVGGQILGLECRFLPASIPPIQKTASWGSYRLGVSCATDSRAIGKRGLVGKFVSTTPPPIQKKVSWGS